MWNPFLQSLQKSWCILSHFICNRTYRYICMHVCMHARSLQSCCDPMDCNPPGSSVYGILQARILEWVAMSSCRGSSWPRDQISISYQKPPYTHTHTHTHIYLRAYIHTQGFPGGTSGKESNCNPLDLGSITGRRRSPGEGNGNPLQYSCLENPMDRGAWWATVHGVTKSRTWLSTHTHTHTHTH